jgi:hypothetical protein
VDPMVPASPSSCTYQTAGAQYDALVIVHGTFAKDAAWTQAGTPLVTRLTDELKLPVIRFGWSGINSHTARIAAGGDLAEFISDLRSAGHKSICIVAHSHGGNVVLYALRSQLVQETVRGILFLGTPFLWILSRPVERFSRFFTEIISWLILFPGLMPIGIMAAMETAEYLYGPAAGGFMLFFGNGIMVLTYLCFRPKLQRLARRLLGNFLKRKQLEFRALLYQPMPICETLITTITRDEASRFLRTIDYITVTPWILVDYPPNVLPR